MSAPADRQRRYRRRQLVGEFVVPVAVGTELAEALIEAGWLAPGDLDNRPAVGDAISALLAWWAARYGPDADAPVELRDASRRADNCPATRMHGDTSSHR